MKEVNNMKNLLPEIKTSKRTYPSLKSVFVCLVFGAILAVFAYSVYLKREAMVYAYMNTNKVEWLMEGDKKAQADSELKLKEAISRLFISEAASGQ